MYKKVYLEITNNCNLNCRFCLPNMREKKFMTTNKYKIILNKLKPYTKYLYLHVAGEPLLHPQINEFIDIAKDDFYINITTNGYLIKRIMESTNIRQINISLHSYDSKYPISLNKYLTDIADAIKILHHYSYISLRFWTNNEDTPKMLKILENKLQCKIELKDNFKIMPNVFVSLHEEFVWPTLEQEQVSLKGTCYALKDHLGILVNGDVVPCCLDIKGIMKLGNIFTDDLKDIMASSRYQDMLKGFQNHQKIEPLCQKCHFIHSQNT